LFRLSLTNKTKDHLELNPQGLVPFLNIDGSSFTQSLAIIEYLDTTRNLDLLPDASAERALCQALAHSIAVDIHPICNLSVTAYAVELTDRQEPRDLWMKRFIEPGLNAF
jgi:maleylacetoacetate isomerase